METINRKFMFGAFLFSAKKFSSYYSERAFNGDGNSVEIYTISKGNSKSYLQLINKKKIIPNTKSGEGWEQHEWTQCIKSNQIGEELYFALWVNTPKNICNLINEMVSDTFYTAWEYRKSNYLNKSKTKNDQLGIFKKGAIRKEDSSEIRYLDIDLYIFSPKLNKIAIVNCNT